MEWLSDIVAQAYNRGARAYAGRWSHPHPWLDQERSHFAQYAGPGKSLLDVGCGPGHDSAYWSAHGCHTLGIDVSEEMLSIARELYPLLAFRQSDLLQMDLFGERYDCIWMSYVLLHIPVTALTSALDVMRAILSEHGAIFISTPISEATSEGLSAIAGLLDQDGKPISVPCSRWELAGLREAIQVHFTESWSRVDSPLENRSPTYSGIWKARE